MDKEKIIYIIISAVIALTAGIAAIIHFLPESSPDNPEIIVSPPVSSSAAIRNQAEKHSEPPVTVYITNETLPVTVSSPQTDIPAESGTVNLNTADKEKLMTLKGIGEKKALMIIEYRELHNGFSCVEELTEVKGIGEKTLEKLREFICV